MCEYAKASHTTVYTPFGKFVLVSCIIKKYFQKDQKWVCGEILKQSNISATNK